MTTTTSDGGAGSGPVGGAGTGPPNLTALAVGTTVAVLPLLFVALALGAPAYIVVGLVVCGTAASLYLRRCRPRRRWR